MTPEDYQAIIKRMEAEVSELMLANQELARIGQRRDDEITNLRERARILECLVRSGARMADEAQSYLGALATVLHVLPTDLTEVQVVNVDDAMAAALDKATGEVHPT